MSCVRAVSDRNLGSPQQLLLFYKIFGVLCIIFHGILTYKYSVALEETFAADHIRLFEIFYVIL